jgi:hypothetical protein
VECPRKKPAAQQNRNVGEFYTHEEYEYKEHEYKILELPYDDHNTTSVFYEVDSRNVAIDAENRRCYSISKNYETWDCNLKCYDLEQGKVIKTYKYEELPIDCMFADQDENGNFLIHDLTLFDEDDVNVVTFDSKSGEFEKICKGSYPHFGCDNYIYFVRGTTELWRCNRDGSSDEPICIMSKRGKKANVYYYPLWISRDRSFLIFDYRIPLFGSYYKIGLVLLDLNKREYRINPKGIYKERFPPVSYTPEEAERIFGENIEQ